MASCWWQSPRSCRCPAFLPQCGHACLPVSSPRPFPHHPAGVLAGHLSDKTGSSAVVAVSFTLLSIPCLYLYRHIGHRTFSTNVVLMMASGFFVNGPYALITTAVSADLGTHDSLQVRGKGGGGHGMHPACRGIDCLSA